jgi:hypothetical protein
VLRRPLRDALGWPGAAAGYRVYRNGVLVARVRRAAWQDRHVRPRRRAAYRVAAVDRAGSAGARTTVLGVTVPRA